MDPSIEVKEVVSPATPAHLAVLKVKRTQAGLDILIHSPIIGEWVKSLSVGQNLPTPTMSPVQTWPGYLWRGSIPDLPDAIFNRWGEAALFYDHRVNLSMLKSTKLTEGFTCTLPGVYSKEKVQEWLQLAKRALVNLYIGYMKPLEVELDITFKSN